MQTVIASRRRACIRSSFWILAAALVAIGVVLAAREVLVTVGVAVHAEPELAVLSAVLGRAAVARGLAAAAD